MDIVEKLAVIGLFAVIVFFATTIVYLGYWIKDKILDHLYEMEERRKQEYMKIKNHKRSQYYYIPQKNGMTEIRRKESC